MRKRILKVWGGLELRVARALFRLPPSLLIRLSGKPPVQRDGLTLDPEMQLLLALHERRGGNVRAETPRQARKNLRRETVYLSTAEPVGAVHDLCIEGPAGPLHARHYAPDSGGAPRPLLVYFHGGGFVTGDLDTHDAPCRLLCKRANVHVLAVDYRLAPEHPFPAAVDDAQAALRWAHAHATELGAEPTRIGVGGDSAGANLSAVLAQRGARGEGPDPLVQMLVYPPTDRAEDHPSMKLFSEGFLLTRETIDWYNQCYFGHDWSLARDPGISPLHAPDLSGQCPALVVTGGFDPLRDEGEAYAEALKNAGVPTRLRRHDGLLHGFVNMAGVSPAARRAVEETADALREQFDRVPERRLSTQLAGRSVGAWHNDGAKLG